MNKEGSTHAYGRCSLYCYSVNSECLASRTLFLLASLKLFLQGSQSVDVTQGSRSGNVLYHRCLFLLAVSLLGSLLLSALLSLGSILEDAAVREDDTLSVLVELDHLELQLLFELSL